MSDLTEARLDDLLSTPRQETAAALEACPGDVVVLGAGGKMGPTLARMIRRAWDTLGRTQRVYGVARFSNPAVAEELKAHGVEPLRCDLLNRADVQGLPDAPNVIFMAGQKFGTTEAPERTWVLNTLVPALVAERYAGARTVVFSTGCVYPNSPIARGGSREGDPLEPLGEYANSCIGRERVFEYFSRLHGTPTLLFRLNYAIDLRYGVLLDVAQKVAQGEPVDLTMGHVNVIWQGDASAWAIQCLEHAACPPVALNITGPETVSIRTLAARFGELLGRAPAFVGEEAETALLSNAGQAHRLFGYPTVTLEQMTEWVAQWVQQGGPTLNKPTHFEARDGKF